MQTCTSYISKSNGNLLTLLWYSNVEGRSHLFCEGEEGASTKAREIIRLKPTDL